MPVFFHFTSSRRMSNRRSRSDRCASGVGNSSGTDDGSSTNCEKITARATANGLRDYHR